MIALRLALVLGIFFSIIIQPSLPVTQPEPIATPLPGSLPASITPITTHWGELLLEEYPIVAEGEDTPIHFDFKQRIPAPVFTRRAAWRTSPYNIEAEEVNRALSSYGYTIRKTGSQTFDLLQNGSLLRQIARYFPPSSDTGDFAMLVEEAGGQGKTYLLRAAGLKEWDSMQHNFARPVLTGGRLIRTVRSSIPGIIEVWADDQIVYTHYFQENPVSEPVKHLWTWNGHWVLEIAGQVIIDGASLNRQTGADEIFSWQLLNGQPFYFFRKDGRTGLSYAGAALREPVSGQPLIFDQVIHNRCCEPAAFNPGGNPTMLWFYASRTGMWEYVELGVYR